MKLDYFFYRVQTEVIFTKADIDIAIRCSQRHYDAKCRAASEIGGFLYGMRNKVHDEESATHGFSWDELDTLQKIMEGAMDAEEATFYNVVRRIFAETRKESERVNARTP